MRKLWLRMRQAMRIPLREHPAYRARPVVGAKWVYNQNDDQWERIDDEG